MIAIVTDSSAGISREDAKEWGISIVPMTYTADEKQFFEDISARIGTMRI